MCERAVVVAFWVRERVMLESAQSIGRPFKGGKRGEGEGEEKERGRICQSQRRVRSERNYYRVCF